MNTFSNFFEASEFLWELVWDSGVRNVRQK